MNIIITGASRGIGYETTLQLAKQEDSRILALARSERKLKRLQNEVAERDGNKKLLIECFDLAQGKPEDLCGIISQIGHIDILINNAGLLINKDFEQLTDEDWQNSYEVNLFGQVRLIKYLLPRLGGSHRSHIVNISSMGGVQGSAKFPGLAAYSSSKAALANLTEVLAEEFKNKNIAVNCLAFGAVQTEMLEEVFPGYQAPLRPDEMAEFVAWFATNGHRFFNGKILPVAMTTP